MITLLYTRYYTHIMITINYLPILVASLVAFGLSSLWYSPILFGNEWLAERKISLEKTGQGSIKSYSLIKSYTIQIIFTLITFAVLGFIISVSTQANGSDGAFLGFLTWVGFILPNSISGFLWKNETLTLTLIDSINYLIILTIGGAIIGAWN
jgi:hypothetical protein